MDDSYSENEISIGLNFKTLLHEWVMNPCSHPDLYFRDVTEDVIWNEDFEELHDELETTLKETCYADDPRAELTLEETEPEPASKYDNPLPADFAGFSYHIPEEIWELRALPKPFKKRINFVLESNCPDYGYIYHAFKSLLTYAFVPQHIKYRSITRLFREKIKLIYKLVEVKERRLNDFLRKIRRKSNDEGNEMLLDMIEIFEDRLATVYQTLDLLRILDNFGEY